MAKKNLQEKLFESVDANAELNEKQKLFCVFYVQSFNATQAYLKAFGRKNKNSARVIAHELLTKPNIQAEILKLKEETRKYFDVGMEDYINYLLKVVGAKISDFADYGNRKGKNFVKLLNADSIDDTEKIFLEKFFKIFISGNLHGGKICRNLVWKIKNRVIMRNMI